MSARAEILLLEARLFYTARSIMAIPSSGFVTCGGVNVLTAELFPTLKAPRFTATCFNNKFSLCG
jgi:hypothetical protein